MSNPYVPSDRTRRAMRRQLERELAGERPATEDERSELVSHGPFPLEFNDAERSEPPTQRVPESPRVWSAIAFLVCVVVSLVALHISSAL